ncbi:MAG: arginine--tRNA ligase [Salibacteraceae bacterium]
MNVEDLLLQQAAAAVTALYDAQVDEKQLQLQKTRKEFEGEFTLVVFPLTRISRQKPEETAEAIGTWMLENTAAIQAYNVVTGFLNLALTDAFWLGHLQTMRGFSDYGMAQPSGRTVMLEYSSPNTNKPLHLGHVRNNLLGYSVSRILEANGHKVIKANLINDRGIHSCKSMLAWQRYGNGETPESSGLKGDHLVGKYYVLFDTHYKEEVAELEAKGIDNETAKKEAPLLKEAQEMLRKWEANDPAIRSLWETMNNWVYDGFETTYRDLGVSFDQYYYESNTYLLGKETVEEGLAKGVLYQKEDGSVWARLSDFKLDDKLLLRADGTSVYMTQDLGTAIERFRQFPDLKQLIYTVGDEQNHHFKVLFLILGMLGYNWAKDCSHLSYGMVDLPSGRMKSREGTVVDADDLVAELDEQAAVATREKGKLEGMSEEELQKLFRMIGLGALKFFILKVDPQRRMTFNPEESVSLNGNTGPFVQYSHARIQSLLRKIPHSMEDAVVTDQTLLAPERSLIALLNDYPRIVKEAGTGYSPALLANYGYDLAKSFNQFYNEVKINDPQSPAAQVHFRLALADMVGRVVKSCMGLLGIEVPDRM